MNNLTKTILNHQQKLNLLFFASLSLLILITSEVAAQAKSIKPRTIVTTDGEVDDVDSFIRLLLYANEFDIVGLVYILQTG